MLALALTAFLRLRNAHTLACVPFLQAKMTLGKVSAQRCLCLNARRPTVRVILASVTGEGQIRVIIIK